MPLTCVRLHSVSSGFLIKRTETETKRKALRVNWADYTHIKYSAIPFEHPPISPPSPNNLSSRDSEA